MLLERTEESFNLGATMYTKFIIRLIDAIPTPTPEQGDRWVTYTCIFGFGFILGMLVTGG